MVGYRLLLALYCLSWIIYSIIADNTWKWFIFLTDWTFLCVTSYFIWSTVISVIYWIHNCKVTNHEPEEQCLPEERGNLSKEQSSASSRYLTPRQSASLDSSDGLLEEQYVDVFEDTEPLHATDQEIRQSDTSTNADHAYDVGYSQAWYHKVSWLLFIIAANNSLPVTVVYWTLLYTGFHVGEIDITFHLLNSVFMLTETCLSNIPVCIVHVVYAMLYGVFYILFSVVYWLLGGTNDNGDRFIYPILDYGGNPHATVLLVLLYGLVGLPVAQLIHFGLFRLRSYLRSLQNSYR